MELFARSLTVALLVLAAALFVVAASDSMTHARSLSARLSAVIAEVLPKSSLILPVTKAAIAATASTNSVDTNPFGVATSATSFTSYASWGPKVSALGVGWIRGFDTFSNIEPTQGSWQWSLTDTFLNTASANGMSTSGLYFYGSPWISSAGVFPTANLPAWSTYVAQVAGHVNGQTKYFEVWNEPPNFTNNTGTPATYAQLLSAAYTSAHQADSSTNVGMAAESNNVNWLDQTLVDGGTGHYDYISLHPYELLGAVDNGFEAEFMSIVPVVRKMLAARDPSKATVPIWFTELGEAIGQANGTSTVTAISQAGALVKAYSMGLAQGVARIDWFEGQDGDSGPMGLFDSSGNPRPASVAMAQMIQYLGTKPVYAGWVLLNNRDYGFIFTATSGNVMVTWSPPGSTDSYAVGQTVKIVDPTTAASSTASTVKLSNSPLLVVGVPANLVLNAQLNISKPFPWGGDFSHSTSVSLATYSPNFESGLHQLYADATSTFVTINGGWARSCGKASGQAFTVDPNFLSYTSRSIKITAVVRNIATAGGAGFNLKYESVSGWKSTGVWTNVPVGSQWYTVSWTLSDPQFVGKWGYNFTFDSDSTIYSQYDLQSVTVTKL